jgi:hypothetical protein
LEGDAASGGDRQKQIRDLEGRLRSLLAQIDASRDEMSEGDVDSSQLLEVGALRREIDDLRQLEKGA